LPRMAAVDEDEQLNKLVNGHEDLEFKQDEHGKVRCKSTGHEMLPKLEIVSGYINGGKYKKAKDWYSCDFSKFEPHIVAHSRLEKFLYCTLTGTTLPKDPAKIERHMGSKRFKELVTQREAKTAERQKKYEEKKKRRDEMIAKKKEEKAAKADGTANGGAKAKGAPKKKLNSRRRLQAKSKAKKAAKDAAKVPGQAGVLPPAKKKPERAATGMRKKQFAEGESKDAGKADAPPAKKAKLGAAKKSPKKA